MFSVFLARVGLDTLKSQIIAGVGAVLIVVIPITVNMLVNGWKSDIAENATTKVVNEIQEERIKTIEAGKEVDDKILQSNDDELCALLGGCDDPDGVPNDKKD